MKNIKDILRLYAVSDDVLLEPHNLLDGCLQAIKGGITALQVRNKSASYSLELLKELAQLCKRNDVALFINDDVHLAAALGVNVHLGQKDCDVLAARQILGDEAIIGLSCQTLDQANKAARDKADYIGVGAVAPTSSKKDASVLSKSTVEQICANSLLPVVLIGGINAKNIRNLKGLKFAGVAAISAIFGSSDIEQSCKELDNLLKEIL